MDYYWNDESEIPSLSSLPGGHLIPILIDGEREGMAGGKSWNRSSWTKIKPGQKLDLTLWHDPDPALDWTAKRLAVIHDGQRLGWLHDEGGFGVQVPKAQAMGYVAWVRGEAQMVDGELEATFSTCWPVQLKRWLDLPETGRSQGFPLNQRATSVWLKQSRKHQETLGDIFQEHHEALLDVQIESAATESGKYKGALQIIATFHEVAVGVIPASYRERVPWIFDLADRGAISLKGSVAEFESSGGYGVKVFAPEA